MTFLTSIYIDTHIHIKKKYDFIITIIIIITSIFSFTNYYLILYFLL